MRDFDDEERGEGLPCQLGDGRDAPYEGVLVADEVGVGLEAEDCPVAQDGFIEDLMKDQKYRFGEVETKRWRVSDVPVESKSRPKC